MEAGAQLLGGRSLEHAAPSPAVAACMQKNTSLLFYLLRG